MDVIYRFPRTKHLLKEWGKKSDSTLYNWIYNWIYHPGIIYKSFMGHLQIFLVKHKSFVCEAYIDSDGVFSKTPRTKHLLKEWGKKI